MEILVFKTNVRNHDEISTIAPHLRSLKGITRWTIDLDDIDKVLRIEADGISVQHVEKALSYAGYDCAELPD